MQFGKGRESVVDLSFVSGFQDMEPDPFRARCFLSVPNDALGIRVIRVYQQGYRRGSGNQFGYQIELFRDQLDGEEGEARKVTAGPGQTRDHAVRDRVAAGDENDRDRRGRVFRCQCRKVAAGCKDQVHPAGDKLCGERGQPIVMPLGPAVFDRQVLSVDVADFAQAPTKRLRRRDNRTTGGVEPDHRRRSLLRARRAPRSSRRPAKASTRGVSFDHPVGEGRGLIAGSASAVRRFVAGGDQL